jgi:hypothetical protein
VNSSLFIIPIGSHFTLAGIRLSRPDASGQRKAE